VRRAAPTGAAAGVRRAGLCPTPHAGSVERPVRGEPGRARGTCDRVGHGARPSPDNRRRPPHVSAGAG
jgi:hypothetical protein